MSRKAIIALPILAASLTAAHAESSRIYDFTGFNNIEAQAGLNVSVQYGEKHHIEVISKKSKYFDKLDISQDNDSLVVTRKGSWGIVSLLPWAQNWTNSVQVIVTMPTLDRVEASSGADLTIGAFNLEKLSLEASSGADIHAADIKVGSIKLDASSGATLSITGTCDSLNGQASSGADIWASELECADGVIDVSSGADIDANITNRVNVDASSGGTVNIIGSPETIKTENSSGGSVKVER